MRPIFGVVLCLLAGALAPMVVGEAAAASVPGSVTTGRFGPWIAEGSRLYRVDVGANAIDRPGVRVPGRIRATEQSASGLWVVSDRGVFLLDPARKGVRRVAAIRGPLRPTAAVDASPGGRLFLVRDDPLVNPSPPVLARASLCGPEPLRQVTLPGRGARDVVVTRGRAWVAVSTDRAPWGRLLAYDAGSLAGIGGWRLPGYPAGMARWRGSLWIAVRRPGERRFRLVRFDLRRERLVGGTGFVPGVPEDLDAYRSRGWVATDQTVLRFDLAHGRYIGRTDASLLFPFRVAAGSRWAWLTTRNGLVRIDARSGVASRAPAPFGLRGRSRRSGP